ncbi:hypothetical protein FQA39_LY17768 [Lamprigera yunnana]|nr:hypothetical protein FQA39_LY17768 [Lamprigera yunnana]
MQHPNQQLKSLSKQLRGKAAKFWADNQYFVTEYDEFVQALFKDFTTPQAMCDRRVVIRSRLKKKDDEAALSVPQEETQTATPASTDAKVKFEVELEPSQRETEVTQPNAFTDTTVALLMTKAAEDEVLVKEERPADFNNEEPLDNDHDANVDKTRKKQSEQSTAAVEEESLAKTENDEVGKKDGIPEGEAGKLEKQDPE